MKRILIVDDEEGVRESLRFALQDRYRVYAASTAREALESAAKIAPDLIVLDIILPDKSGLETLKELKKAAAGVSIIMLTALSEVKTAVEAMRLGADDYLTKPYDVEELRIAVRNVLKGAVMKERLSLLKEEVNGEYPVDRIVCGSAAMDDVLDRARKIAAADSAALLTGPTGVGKELVARFIHACSRRKDEPFVPIHCAAIPETLFESELFGHEKGAFTNAVQRKPGKIELAGSGTIFLDEVSEIPLPLQVKLLRFLQEKDFSRLGGNEVLRSEARVISASSKNLIEESRKGSFREDLFYRLSVVPLDIPALRERREDVALLTDYYFEYFRARLGCGARELSDGARRLLEEYDWPGNVRELKNIIERILVLNGNGSIINERDLPAEIIGREPAAAGKPDGEIKPFKEAIEELERQLLALALRKAGGNQSRAAEMLRTTRRVVRYKARKYSLDT